MGTDVAKLKVLTECNSEYLSYKTDCEGDVLAFCYAPCLCKKKKLVTDCEGDLLSLCNKYQM